jgi:hypothetical protein
MKLYYILLHLIGYSLYVKKSNIDDEPIIVIVDSANDNVIVERRNRNSEKNKIRKLVLVLKIIYNIFIFSIISWQIVYALIYSIQQNEILYFGGYLFQLIFATQYVIGLTYFKDDHFYKKMESNKKLEKYLSILFPICVCISVILSIITITFTYYNITLSKMSMLYVFSQHMSPFLIFLIVLDKFYGYFSFLINVSTFSIIIYDHHNEASEYTKRIEKYMQGSVTISDKMFSISTELIKIKDSYKTSVEKLNLMFSSLTILGLCYVSFTIKIMSNYQVDTINIINLVLFLIVEYVYIFTAQNFRSSASNISASIYRNVHAIHFLQKNNSKQETIIAIPNDEIDDDDDLDSTKKHQPYATISKSKSDNINKKTLEEISKIHQSERSIKSHINLLHIAVRKIHIYNAEIAENVTWSHLQEIVKKEWEPFQVLGIEIKDTLLIQKLIGAIIAIIIAKDLIDLTTF